MPDNKAELSEPYLDYSLLSHLELIPLDAIQFISLSTLSIYSVDLEVRFCCKSYKMGNKTFIR